MSETSGDRKENVNCLEGYACPRCGYDEELRIICTTLVTMTDDGSDDIGDLEWDENSHGTCPKCGFADKMEKFRVDAVPTTYFTAVLRIAVASRKKVEISNLMVEALESCLRLDLLTEEGQNIIDEDAKIVAVDVDLTNIEKGQQR